MNWIESFFWLVGKTGVVMVNTMAMPYLAATEIQRQFAETWVGVYRP